MSFSQGLLAISSFVLLLPSRGRADHSPGEVTSVLGWLTVPVQRLWENSRELPKTRSRVRLRASFVSC